MAHRNSVVAARPTWMELAEEVSEAERLAVAKAALEANFNNIDINKPKAAAVMGADSSERQYLPNKPIGPFDPDKCTADGVYGGCAGSPSSFVVTVRDSDGRNIPNCGAQIVAMVVPGVGVWGSDIYGVVTDEGDGTYSVTYVVPKSGNYMVNVECNGFPIMGSPFPVFFSAGSANGGLHDVAPTTSYPNLVNANMPNMPNYAGSVSGSFPGLSGMIPELVPGPSERAIFSDIEGTLGKICHEFLKGRCFRTDCNSYHPSYTLLMTTIVNTSKNAQAIMAAQSAQALQAHAAQQAPSQSSEDSTGVSEKDKDERLKRTVRVRNLVPNITADHMERLFGVWNPVVQCTISDPEHFAYIEYSKPEHARAAALALNNFKLCGLPLNVEIAKSLPPKPTTSSPDLRS